MAEGGIGELREDSHAGDGLEVKPADEHRQTDQHQAEQPAEGHLGVLGPLDAGLPEGGDGIRDRLDAGERRAAGGERAEQQQDTHRARVGGEFGGVPGGEEADGRVTEQSDDDHSEDRDDEDRGGDHEDAGGLRDAPQVDGGDQGEHRQAEPHPVAVEAGEGRGERGHAGGDRDRDVEHVVDDEGGSGDQRGAAAEVGPGNGVGPAAVREGGDDLPVRQGEHPEQDGDGDGHRQCVAQAVGSGCGEDHHDRLRPVRDRGHGVEGERGEPAEGGQPVPSLAPGERRSGAGAGAGSGAGFRGLVVLAPDGGGQRQGRGGARERCGGPGRQARRSPGLCACPCPCPRQPVHELRTSASECCSCWPRGSAPTCGVDETLATGRRALPRL